MSVSKSSTTQASMYGSRAEYYDLIYHWKKYGEEAARLHEILNADGVADGGHVLEAACGTGRYIEHLRHSYVVSGFDLAEEMIHLARRRVPDAQLFTADMTDFSVETPVDAIVCLFSSIGYVHPIDRLRAAAACFARALRPGGVLIIEPWLEPDAFEDGHVFLHTYTSDDVKLCRAALSRRQGEHSVIEFQWLAARTGGDAIDHFTETHELWLCARDTMVEVFTGAGFDCRYEAEGLMPGRGLLIGRRM